MVRVLLVVVGLMLFPGIVWGQESCAIRLKPAGEGETTRYEDTLTTEMRTRQVDSSGYVVADRRDHSVRRAVYTETLQELDGATQQPKRLRRQCEKATLEVNGKGMCLPYHGKSFVVERGAEGCRVRFEGDPPSQEFVRQLEAGFRDKKDASPLPGMLPAQGVQVGESWAFDPRPLLTAWPKPPQVCVDLEKAKGTGKLIRTYRQGERLFGVLEFRAEAPVGGVTVGSRQATVAPGAKLEVAVDVEACIDGSASTCTLRLADELTVHMEMPGPPGQKIEGTIAEQHVRTETRR